ncbi:hypothetical protein CYMTET_50115 [Cymbomonas tetramitiformis]|uniref:Uncharacterized protein n=1 Tax=Cymbomonas tetramitiformis TaxID=36881 RepID=A0AAE0EU11_9CHLO|nr:hypothetical protein CYMTET_50115 [Cymbomonas tetramitiformis]
MPAASAVASTAKKSYQWNEWEVHVVLNTNENLGGNKHATVRWFQENLKGSEIAARLKPSNIQYWLTLRSTDMKAKRGRKLALGTTLPVYADCVSACKTQLAFGLPGDVHILGAIVKAVIAQSDHASILANFQVSPTWTYAFLHANVPLIGLDDKRQITGVVVEGLDENGDAIVVGIQLIYTGITDRCLPGLEHRSNELFADFDFTYTYNHWADEETNYRLFDKLIIPHLVATKERLHLPPDHPALCLLDCWPVQKKESFRERVKTSWPWLHLEYIPPGCTGKAQKFDLDGGGVYTPKLQQRTTAYIQEEFQKSLSSGVALSNVKLDLTLTTMKVRQLYWILEVHTEFKNNVAARNKGWQLTGIPNAFTEACQQKALERHVKGELWPSSALEDVPEGEEHEPSPESDDTEAGVEDPQSATGGGASTSAVPTASCTGIFENVGSEIEGARNARKRKGSEVEFDVEFDFEDMTDSTYAVVLAPLKDEFSFTLKVGKFVSPWLYLVSGFTEGRHITEVWEEFDAGEIVYCWDAEEDDANGIPENM